MSDIAQRLRQYGDGLPGGLLLMREAADEIEHLVDAQRGYFAVSRQGAITENQLRAEIAQLRSQLNEHAETCTESANPLKDMRSDAERYRWLRMQPHVAIASAWFLPSDQELFDDGDPASLDAAIDKAIGVKP